MAGSRSLMTYKVGFSFSMSGCSPAEAAKRVRWPAWVRWERLQLDHSNLVFHQESGVVQRFLPSDFSLKKGRIVIACRPQLSEHENTPPFCFLHPLATFFVYSLLIYPIFVLLCKAAQGMNEMYEHWIDTWRKGWMVFNVGEHGVKDGVDRRAGKDPDITASTRHAQQILSGV